MWRGDSVLAVGGRYALVIDSEPGLLVVSVSRAGPGGATGWWHRAWPHARGWSAWGRLGPRWSQRLGFAHYSVGNMLGGRIDQFTIPYYFAVAVAGLLPGLFLARISRARRRTRVMRAAGLCPACGYDLRAAPGRCPECGRAVAV